MHLLWQAVWGDIWKPTVEKSQTNAINVTMHLLVQTVWGYVWKHTVDKSQTNVTNVTIHLLWQAIWRDMWPSGMLLFKRLRLILGGPFEDSFENTKTHSGQTNATNVIMPLLRILELEELLHCLTPKRLFSSVCELVLHEILSSSLRITTLVTHEILFLIGFHVLF